MCCPNTDLWVLINEHHGGRRRDSKWVRPYPKTGARLFSSNTCTAYHTKGHSGSLVYSYLAMEQSPFYCSHSDILPPPLGWYHSQSQPQSMYSSLFSKMQRTHPMSSPLPTLCYTSNLPRWPGPLPPCLALSQFVLPCTLSYGVFDELRIHGPVNGHHQPVADRRKPLPGII